MIRIVLTLLTAACSIAGPSGADGRDGVDGTDGQNGLSCWDLDKDGIGDDEEDVNADGSVDTKDCVGTNGDRIPYLGNLRIRDVVTAEEFCRQFDRIYGDLTIGTEYDGEDLSAMHCLKEVRGDVFLEPRFPKPFSLPLLQEVTGTMRLEGVDSSAYDLPSLSTVGSHFEVYGRSPRSFRAPMLHRVSGELRLELHGATEIQLPLLTEVEGPLVFNGTGLANLNGIPAVTFVDGELEFSENKDLKDVSALSTVEEIAGIVRVFGCPNLSESHVREVFAGAARGGFDFRGAAP